MQKSRQLGEGKSKHSVCLIRDSEIFPHFLSFLFLQVDPYKLLTEQNWLRPRMYEYKEDNESKNDNLNWFLN